MNSARIPARRWLAATLTTMTVLLAAAGPARATTGAPLKAAAVPETAFEVTYGRSVLAGFITFVSREPFPPARFVHRRDIAGERSCGVQGVGQQLRSKMNRHSW